MGLFDSLLKAGVRAVTSKAVDAAFDAVVDAVKGDNQSGNSKTTFTQSTEDNRSFDEKINAVLENLGTYEIRKDISPDTLEQEAGVSIYTRGGCYAKPDNFTYTFYKEGQRVLIVNLWDDYQTYKHMANREIKDYCGRNGITVLDFFDYLPNEFGYMEQRIREAL